MRRILALVLAVAAATLALTLATCGDETSSKGPLDDALSYLPRDTAVVATIDTDPKGAQVEQLETLIDKFAFADQVKERVKQGFARGLGDFERIEPLLGNDLVLGLFPGPDHSRQFVTALTVKDPGDARALLSERAIEDGEANGATVYRLPGGSSGYAALDGDVLVSAPTRELVQQAVDRRHGGDHMDAETFEEGVGDLPDDALVRIYVNLESAIAKRSDAAQRIKWVAALKSFGITIRAEDDGIAADLRADTEGDLTNDDLPLAAGPESPGLVKREGELGIAIRDLTRPVRFAEQALQAGNPRKFGDYSATKQRVGRTLGIDVDRDLIDPLREDTSLSIGVDGGYATRTSLRDPRAYDATLAKLADGYPKLRRLGAANDTNFERPKEPGGLYVVTGHEGRRTYVGVVNSVLVTGSAEERARSMAEQQPQRVAGAQGAVALFADAQAIANEIIDRRSSGIESLFARQLTGPLGDVTGWAKATPDEIRGKLKLKIE